MWESSLFCASVVLALPLGLGFLVLALHHVVARRRFWDTPRMAALTVGVATWLGAGLWLTWRIFTADSSTAVIGCYGLPLFSTLVAVAAFLPTWFLALLVARWTGWGRGR